MKKGIALTLLLSVLFVTQGTIGPQGTGPGDSGEEEGESADDPSARSAFERMKLQNPSTGRIPAGIRKKELAFAATLPTRESVRSTNRGKGGGERTLQELSWSARGPSNVGGRTRALAIDVTNPNVILAGGVSGGMWRSSDGGASWTAVTDVSDLQSVTCIAQDTRPGHTNVWYYGTGESNGNSAGSANALLFGDGMFISTDNGVSWEPLLSTSTGTVDPDNVMDLVYRIVVDPSDTVDDNIYAATYTSIQRSTDGGASWQTAMGDSVLAYSGSFFTEIVVSPTGVLYATMSSVTFNTLFGIDTVPSAARGIWRSVDGVSWTDITPAGFPSTYRRIVIGMAPSNEDVLYFLGDTPGSGTHIVYGDDNWTSFWKYTYFSGDGSGAGGVWEDRTGNLPTSSTRGGTFAHQHSYDMFVGVKPDIASVVYIGGVNMFRSLDGFASSGSTVWVGGWDPQHNPKQYPDHHSDQHALVFAPDDSSVIYTGSDGGVHRATENYSPLVWTPLNTGYRTAQFYTLAIDHGTVGNEIVVGGLQDNGTVFTHSTDPDSDWIRLNGGDGAYCAIVDGRSFYYVSTQYGGILRLELGDDGVETGRSRIDPVGADAIFINPYALDPNNMERMYDGGNTTLWRNDDLSGIPLNNNTTTLINWTELTNSEVGEGSILSIAVSKTPANRVYYGTTAGTVYRLDSADVGDHTPLNITGGIFPAGGVVTCIAIDPTDADRAMVVFSNYGVVSLFYTTDGGTGWTDVAGNLEEFPDGSGNGPSCRWAVIIPGQGAFVGTSTGLYSTALLDGSSTLWIQEGSTTIGNTVVDMMDVRLSDGRIVAATHGRGVFSASLGAGSVFYQASKGWNLVSVPLVAADFRKDTLYPLATTDAYSYTEAGYSTFDTLATGAGYWLKFSSGQTVQIAGAMLAADTIHVREGWNMVGSLSSPVAAANVGSIPGGIVTSAFYGYENGYVGSPTIEPGRGYWVKVTQEGDLVMGVVAIPPANRIRIVDTGEQPPPPPVRPENATPDVFALEQNFPNPFNPVTRIGYSLPVRTHVTLSVFNTVGQRVAVLVDEVQDAGNREVAYDGSTLPSGVYFYRLEAETFSDSRKMLLLK